MATKYLLPCPCGKSIPVEPSQAGQQLRCDCGQQNEVPSMREVRNLEQQDDASGTKTKGSWTTKAGLVFAAGSIFILLGATICVYSYISRVALQRNLPVRSQEGINEWLSEVDESPPEGLIDIWNDTLKVGFSEAEDSPWKLFRRESRKYDIAIGVGLTACLIGLLAAIGATFLRDPPPASA